MKNNIQHKLSLKKKISNINLFGRWSTRALKQSERRHYPSPSWTRSEMMCHM